LVGRTGAAARRAPSHSLSRGSPPSRAAYDDDDDDDAAAARRPTATAADGLILSGLAVSAHRSRFTRTLSSRSAVAAHNICLEK